jgi:hypothetical protein
VNKSRSLIVRKRPVRGRERSFTKFSLEETDTCGRFGESLCFAPFHENLSDPPVSPIVNHFIAGTDQDRPVSWRSPSVTFICSRLQMDPLLKRQIDGELEVSENEMVETVSVTTKPFVISILGGNGGVPGLSLWI